MKVRFLIPACSQQKQVIPMTTLEETRTLTRRGRMFQKTLPGVQDLGGMPITGRGMRRRLPLPVPVTIATGANLQACLAPLLPPETQRARRQVTSKVRTGRRLTCGVPAALLTRSLGASYTGLVFCDSHMGCSYCRAWGSPREDFTCNLAPARASSSGGPAPSKCSIIRQMVNCYVGITGEPSP